MNTRAWLSPGASCQSNREHHMASIASCRTLADLRGPSHFTFTASPRVTTAGNRRQPPVGLATPSSAGFGGQVSGAGRGCVCWQWTRRRHHTSHITHAAKESQHRHRRTSSTHTCLPGSLRYSLALPPALSSACSCSSSDFDLRPTWNLPGTIQIFKVGFLQ